MNRQLMEYVQPSVSHKVAGIEAMKLDASETFDQFHPPHLVHYSN